MRTVLAVALLVLVVTAGCTGPGGGNQTDTTLVDAATETTSAEATPTETTDETTARTTTLPVTTDEEPQKGDQFLSVSELNESQAMQWNASKRASFGNLSEERQQVVKETIECNCNVELHGEFSFHDKERVEVVEYDGTYYFLRVAIV